MFEDRPGSTVLAERPIVDDAEDDFAFDVRVVVSTDRLGLAECPTSDGSGNTCQTNASACNSFVDDPACSTRSSPMRASSLS